MGRELTDMVGNTVHAMSYDSIRNQKNRQVVFEKAPPRLKRVKLRSHGLMCGMQNYFAFIAFYRNTDVIVSEVLSTPCFASTTDLKNDEEMWHVKAFSCTLFLQKYKTQEAPSEINFRR